MAQLQSVFDRTRYQLLRRRRSNRPKAIGVGLARTGTTSLTEVLETLGYRSLHYPPCFNTTSGALQFSWPWWLSKYDAFTDVPAAYYFREFDRMYPQAKFVLTVRDMDSWLNSCRKHFTEQRLASDSANPGYDSAIALNKAIYSTPTFEADLFRTAWHQHQRALREYFKSRPGDYLEFDLVGGQDLDDLARFLGKEIPGDFERPYSNSRPD